MTNYRYLAVFFSMLSSTLLLQAEWSLYDGFDYNGKLLDGADGGLGAWTSYWRPSMDGGVEIQKPSLQYKDRAGQSLAVSGGYASLVSSATAGTYRDFNAVEARADAPLVFWVSFIAKASGAPFSASGDEISIQLRSITNIDWVSIGVLGRLDAWRVRLSNGSQKLFSEGASGVPTDDNNFFVTRIEVDLRPGKPDSVYLWINPPLGRQPDDSTASIQMTGEDIWQAGTEVDFSRIRIGAINSESPESKSLLFDEIRMGEDYVVVTPSQ